jgi:uncharacterized protein YndB with AHSA1/START domain
MKKENTIDVTVERTLMTTPEKAFSAWLNPKVKGTPWNMGEKILLTPKVDGFFYWLVHGTPHYGRFTKVQKSKQVQHTWMSPYTEGHETTVTVTFKKVSEGTLMTLVHSDLPNNSKGRAHIEGWNAFMDAFPKNFKSATKKKK